MAAPKDPIALPTATEELTPAQLGAAAYEVTKPRVKPEDAIWARLDGEAASGQVVNADPALDYRFLDAASYAADGRRLYEDRQALVNRGFEPISGPLYKGPQRREFVPGVSTAELWCRPRRLADDEFRVLLARNCLSPSWAKIYYRRCVAEGAPERRYLPEGLEYAMLVHHDLLADSKRVLIKPGVPRDHARERLVITNLARTAPVHPYSATQADPVRDAIAAAANTK